jgi:hypothetical protein
VAINNPVSEIVVHVLVDVPHYWPLYKALNRIAEERKVSARLQLHKGDKLDARTLFTEVEREVQSDQKSGKKVLHVVIAGHIEQVYDTFTEINRFVSASILIHRSPLWLYANKSKASAVRSQLDASSTAEISGLVPNEESTLYESLVAALPKIAGLTGLVKDGSLPFEYPPDWAKLKNCDFFASMFPLPGAELQSHDFTPLNFRLPPKHAGFSALWLHKDAVSDEKLTEVWVWYADSIQDVIVELYDADASVFREELSVEKLAEDLSVALRDRGEMLVSTLDRRTWVGATTAPAWENNVSAFLAHFIANRIWDYNFSHAHREGKTTADKAALELLYSRSLTAHLREAHLERFHGKFGPYIEEISEMAGQLVKLADTVGIMRTVFEGSTDRYREADITGHNLRKLLEKFFGITGVHKTSHFYANGKLDEQKLTQAIKQISGDEITSLSQDLNNARILTTNMPNQWGLRFNAIVDLIKLVANSQAAISDSASLLMKVLAKAQKSGAQDESLLLLEMKVISRGGIPSSWFLSTLEKITIEPTQDFVQILGRGVQYRPVMHTTEAGLFSVSQALHSLSTDAVTVTWNPGGEDDSRYGTLVFRLAEEKDGNLKRLIRAIHGATTESAGDTTKNLLLLQSCGFDVRINEEDRTVTIPIGYEMIKADL